MTGRNVSRMSGGIAPRWLLLLVWPCGYAFTCRFFSGFGFQYFAITLLSAIGAALLLLALDGPTRKTLPVWAIFLIFIFGHYLEFYLLVLEPSIMEAYFAPTIITKVAPGPFLAAYAASSGAFGAFCLVSIYFLRAGRQEAGPRAAITGSSSGAGLALVGAAAIMLIGATSMLTVRFDLIGTWNRELLPFHLEGVIDYVRLLTIPLLLFTAINLASRHGRRRARAIWIAVLIVYALSDMLLRTSKGTLMSMAAALLFWRLLEDRRWRGIELAAGGGAMLLGVALFPLLLGFRMLRAGGDGIVGALLNSGRQLVELGGLPSAMTLMFRMLVLRLTGAGAVLALTLRDVRPLGWQAWSTFWGPRSWTGYINVEIFGTSEKFVDYFGIGSSAVGLFYVLGGIAGATVGCALLFAFVLYVWEWLGSRDPRLGPAAQVVFLEMSVWTIIDGSVSLQWLKGLTVLAASIVTISQLAGLEWRRSIITTAMRLPAALAPES